MPTRRTVLATAAGVLAGLPVLGSASASLAAPVPAAGSPIPDTLASRIAVGARRKADEARFPLTHLAVGWTGAAEGAAVRIRTAKGWGDWRPLHGCDGGRDGRATARRALLSVPGGVGYEVQLPGAGTVTELNTVDGPTRTTAAATGSSTPLSTRTVGRPYLSRAAWGADESLRFTEDGTERFPAAYFPVQTVTVHHSAGINDDPDPAATMRAIYYDQTITRDFGDFGYHLAIDEDGRVYEGRWSGTDRFPVYGGALGPNGRPQMNNAAHVGGFNAGNVGVVLLGDFTSRQPTAAARQSLVGVLAAIVALGGLDPLGTTNYVNPISGSTRTVPTIPGHRDWAATLCPGDLFYPELPGVRQDVADLIG
ncbi:peptidoglycan recognition protein family protein [Cryptosporangium aurantiacum]|uniref:N-acetylmuramoyl-L-alanine amidase n=1 Tax=Cryptosporangium aurantiacum TaxID=134849 RepID=A0A1M7RK06_9ACTN|nr:peptidoglycan recognition family protein [Cryptosporangium aurantiacum]SHN46476.1 N-acetylmuramoyl-L-alanine amidase [Cryptosporangium aurantiacum]